MKERFKIFDVSNQTDDEFWTQNDDEYAESVPIKDCAAEILTFLMNEFDIYIITNRVKSFDESTTEKQRQQVIDYLSRNKVHYTKIIFNKGNKLSACLENNVDILIDDCVEHILTVSQEITVICGDAYNRMLPVHAAYNRIEKWDISVIELVKELLQ